MKPTRAVVLLLLTFVVVLPRADAEPSAAERNRRKAEEKRALSAGILGKAPPSTAFFDRSITIRTRETLEELLPKAFVLQTPLVSPGGDPREIQRFVQTHLDVVYPCFQQPFGGDGAIFFAIDARGHVLDATDSDEEDDLLLRRFEKCFAKRAASWQFPPREFGSRVKVTLAFTTKQQHMARLLAAIEEIKDRARLAPDAARGASRNGLGVFGTIKRGDTGSPLPRESTDEQSKGGLSGRQRRTSN